MQFSILIFFSGAFLIPYILMVFIIGLPIFFAELYLGQYTGIGPNKAFARIAPIFQGIGLIQYQFETINLIIFFSRSRILYINGNNTN